MSFNYDQYIVLPDKSKVHLLDTFVYITIDPSGGSSEATATSRTDKAGWTVCAVDAKDNRYILDLDEAHLTDEQFVDHVYKLWQTYLPRLIGIEKTPHLLSHFRRVEKERKVILPITELRPRGRKKSVRIRSAGTTLPYTYFLAHIQPKVQQIFRKWYDEMQHGDDGIDSFAYLDDIAVAPTEAQLKAHKLEILRAIDRNMLLHLPSRERRDVESIQKLLGIQRENAQEDLEAFYNGE